MDSMPHSMLIKCTYQKTTSSSLLKAHNSKKITSQKKYNKKTTFSRKYFPILLNQMER